MKPIRFDRVRGNRISVVYNVSNNWTKYASSITAPTDYKLFNFNVFGTLEGNQYGIQDLDLVVLDPYGDESLTKSIRKRLLMLNVCEQPLAIDRKTGTLYQTSFFMEDENYGMTITSIGDQRNDGEPYMLPKDYLFRIDELKSSKRPFDISIRPQALVAFIDRQIGYKDLSEEIVVQLSFNDALLEIWGSHSRIISRWDN